jgi:hypothetical protein
MKTPHPREPLRKGLDEATIEGFTLLGNPFKEQISGLDKCTALTPGQQWTWYHICRALTCGLLWKAPQFTFTAAQVDDGHQLRM